jgi:hypothetical protein
MARIETLNFKVCHTSGMSECAATNKFGIAREQNRYWETPQLLDKYRPRLSESFRGGDIPGIIGVPLRFETTMQYVCVEVAGEKN